MCLFETTNKKEKRNCTNIPINMQISMKIEKIENNVGPE
jgi:hypothetical protein